MFIFLECWLAGQARRDLYLVEDRDTARMLVMMYFDIKNGIPVGYGRFIGWKSGAEHKSHLLY
jgi:hypothetical protein